MRTSQSKLNQNHPIIMFSYLVCTAQSIERLTIELVLLNFLSLDWNTLAIRN